MTIYIDVVFIENIIMNYIILYGTGIVAKVVPKQIRLILSSTIGAVYVIVTYISKLRIYETLVLKIVLSFIIIYIAFNPPNIKKLIKELLLFYLTSFVFGGAAFFLIYVVRPQDIIMKNGVFVGTYPIKITIMGGLLGFIVLVLSYKLIKTKFTKKSLICNVLIKIENKELKTKAMVDTGNLLKDPISGKPVIVIEHTSLYDILPKQILNNIEKILGGDFKNIPESINDKYISKFKVIPFSSLGKEHGILLGIKGNEIIIENEEEIIRKKDFIIGIYNKSLTKSGEYKALIGINFL